MKPLVLSSMVAFSMAFVMAHSKDAPFRPQRLPDGQPDLQGTWNNTNATPVARPPGVVTLVISPDQAQAIVDDQNLRSEDRTTPTEPTEYFETRRIMPIRGQLRSSIIIDPPNGMVPGLGDYEAKLSRVRSAVLTAMDGPEERPAPERCLGSITAQPPILQLAANNLHQIIQTRDTIVFYSEMNHEARVIRLNAAHAPNTITSWLGDSIGHWDGDTLIVVTKNFTASDKARTSPPFSYLISPRTVVTERITRVAENVLHYVFTVEDSTLFTRPWTGEMDFLRTNEQIFEYACHEHNYSLTHILQGARVQEKN